jgi:hypothetical protein
MRWYGDEKKLLLRTSAAGIALHGMASPQGRLGY